MRHCRRGVHTPPLDGGTKLRRRHNFASLVHRARHEVKPHPLRYSQSGIFLDDRANGWKHQGRAVRHLHPLALTDRLSHPPFFHIWELRYTVTKMPDRSGSLGAADAERAPEPVHGDRAASRFKSCRWHATRDGGAAYCSHPDVLPYSGMNGFKPAAWCLECTFYKLRRTVKKRDKQPDY